MVPLPSTSLRSARFSRLKTPLDEFNSAWFHMRLIQVHWRFSLEPHGHVVADLERSLPQTPSSPTAVVEVARTLFEQLCHVEQKSD